jgi:protein-disulfide isomerase
MRKRLLIVGLFLAGAAMAAPPTAATVTDQQIRDWLATHPEVLDKLIHDSLLRQAAVLGEMQQAQAAKSLAETQARFRDNFPKLLADWQRDGVDGRAGSGRGPAVIVVFEDAECPFCKGLQPILDKLLSERPDATLIYKDYAILGAGSVIAAKASLAAQRQGKYGALHGALMASKIPEHQLTEAAIFAMAESVGLDLERLRKDMASPEVEASLQATRLQAQTLGIRGTPGLIVNGQIVSAQMPYEQLLRLVDDTGREMIAKTR